MSKTYKFAVVDGDKKAVEMTFYNQEEPVTVIEMLDMFHAFCLGCGVPEATWQNWIYHLAQKYQTPPLQGTVNPSMGASAPAVETIQQG